MSADPSTPTLESVARFGVAPARVEARHWALGLSFLVIVVAPIIVIATYLWIWAADQYMSVTAFSVRSEQSDLTPELTGGLRALQGMSGGETDVLNDFLKSQALVQRVDDALDLRRHFASRHGQDPFLSLAPGASIEALTRHWQRVARITYASETGVIRLETLAYDPEFAQRIAQVVLAESSDLIDRLSDAARRDGLRFALGEREAAADRLRTARVSLSQFRDQAQMIDPASDVSTQMAVIIDLEAQLVEAMISNDMLVGQTRENDPRLENAARKIEALRARIDAERRRISGIGSATGLTDAVSQFEALSVEAEFAETTYIAALAGYDAALRDAQRRTSYLAAHVEPTLAESPAFPARMTTTLAAAGLLLASWSVLVLVAYSIRDRR